MIDQVAIAFEHKDYQTAAKLLKQLRKESPDNPWVQFYLGRLHEVSGKHQDAEKIYRQLLRDTTNTKIVTLARQGLQRLQEMELEERQRAISQATSQPNNTELGVLVLEPLSNEMKTEASRKFAQIMQLDPYTARLILPSRGWRLYRKFIKSNISRNLPHKLLLFAATRQINSVLSPLIGQKSQQE